MRKKRNIEVVDYPETDEDTTDKSDVPVQHYGSGLDIRSLVGRINDKEILVPSFEPESSGVLMPGFQREFVWKPQQQDSFIESLLLGYPVPNIFLVRQADKKFLVLDGQQRLSTIRAFEQGQRPNSKKEFVLGENTGRFAGRTHKSLSPEERRTIDNTVIYAVIIERPSISDPAREAALDDSIFRIFERLNSGGTKLHPHEIRIALYNGPFIRLVRELSKSEDWTSLVGAWAKSWRSSEIITRYFAFSLHAKGYRPPIKKFLNDFVRSRRNDAKSKTVTLAKNSFLTATKLLNDSLGSTAFLHKQTPNAALADAILFGIARRVEAKKSPPSLTKLKSAHARLLRDQIFLDAVEKATADRERVNRRLQLAKKVFSAT